MYSCTCTCMHITCVQNNVYKINKWTFESDDPLPYMYCLMPIVNPLQYMHVNYCVLCTPYDCKLKGILSCIGIQCTCISYRLCDPYPVCTKTPIPPQDPSVYPTDCVTHTYIVYVHVHTVHVYVHACMSKHSFPCI